MSDAYICDYVRTPFGRYGGILSGIRADDLAAISLRALIDRNPDIALDEIDDVLLGCANQAGEDNRNIARMASLLSGLPVCVPGSTVNRLCGSSMDTLISASRAIKSRESELIIAGGVESMSRAPFVVAKAESAFSRNLEVYDTTMGWRFINPALEAQYGADTMPETAEIVAQKYHVSREDQDAFALRSQTRAAAAQIDGVFSEEIVPVERLGENALVDDEQPRPSTTYAKLAKLKTPFKVDGTVTAGNSSGINDGAAALIVASETAMKRYGLQPLARIIGGASAGLEPREMGMGPVLAVQKLLDRIAIPLDKFDVIELNEAFASQAVACSRGLGLEDGADHVNPNGGAIALGHPLGATGARITGTAALELRRKNGRYALASMCIGVGQGIAIALERV